MAMRKAGKIDADESLDCFANLVDYVYSASLPSAEEARYLHHSVEPIHVPHGVRIFIRKCPASKLGTIVHNQYMLIVPLRTVATAVVDNRHIHMNPGFSLLVFPRQVHGYESLVEEEVCWLFCGFMMEDQLSYSPLNCSPVKISQQMSRDFMEILRLSAAASGKEPVGHESLGVSLALRLKLILEQMLEIKKHDLYSVFKKQSENKDAGEFGSIITETFKYINSNLAENIVAEDIAKSLHVSTGHLRNEFHRKLDFALGKYIRYIKMHYACDLITSTSLSLSEVAERCGYSSIYSFSRAFKLEKHISPSQYRNGAYKANY